MKKKTFLIDIDNTICKTVGNNYKNSKPYKNKILLINKLYNKGHIIKFFTSRFMGRSNEKISKAKKRGFRFTKKQYYGSQRRYRRNKKYSIIGCNIIRRHDFNICTMW